MRREISRFANFIYLRVNDVRQDQRHVSMHTSLANTRIPSGDECETTAMKDIKSYERRMTIIRVTIKLMMKKKNDGVLNEEKMQISIISLILLALLGGLCIAVRL